MLCSHLPHTLVHSLLAPRDHSLLHIQCPLVVRLPVGFKLGNCAGRAMWPSVFLLSFCFSACSVAPALFTLTLGCLSIIGLLCCFHLSITGLLCYFRLSITGLLCCFCLSVTGLLCCFLLRAVPFLPSSGSLRTAACTSRL